MKTIKTALVLAGGFGTRMLPATKCVPKELLPLFGKPMIQYIVEELAEAGIENVYLFISKRNELIAKHFDKDQELEGFLEASNKQDLKQEVERISSLVNCHLLYQDEAKGVAHAVNHAKGKITEPFLLAFGDNIIDANVSVSSQLIQSFEKHQKPIIGAIEVPREETYRYGIFDPGEGVGEKEWLANGVIEKPEVDQAPSNLAACGYYALTPEIFGYIDATEPDPRVRNEVQFPDAFIKYKEAEGLVVKAVDGAFLDGGNKLAMLKAAITLASKDQKTKEDLKLYFESL